MKELTPEQADYLESSQKEFKKCVVLNNTPVDFLVFPGHSIVQDRDQTWHMTGLAQTTYDTGRRFAPGDLIFERTGLLEPILPDDKNVREGGGLITAEAVVIQYKLLVEQGNEPKGIIISGGQPSYLKPFAVDENKNLSEAEVAKDYLLKRLGEKGLNPRIHIIGYGNVTQDDIFNTLNLIRQQKGSSLRFIMLDWRILRGYALWKQFSKENEWSNKIDVSFTPSLKFITNYFEGLRYKNPEQAKNTITRWKDFLTSQESSIVYSNTARAENIGVSKIFGSLKK